jgi:RNA-binding protein
MLDKKKVLELRGQAQHLDAIIQVGKSGLTPSAIEEIKRQLKDYKLIKVRLLKSAIEESPREELGKKLAAETGSELIEVKGHTVVLYKK